MAVFARKILLTTVLSVTAPAAVAAPSVADNFDTCRAEAEMLYGNPGAPARVRLDDVRKSGKQLRLRVVTPEGASFNAVCEVNRKSGELVSLDPRAVPGQERQLGAVIR